MSPNFLDGKKLAEKIENLVKKEARNLSPLPNLHVILAGNNLPSQIYVKKKEEACRRLGFGFYLHYLPTESTERQLLDLINQLNEDQTATGVLVQLPLPINWSKEEAFNSLNPAKDVDCLTPTNLGRFMIGQPLVTPATARAVEEILRGNGVETTGKNAVVVGRSQVVGLPVSILLQQMDTTVTICHSRTERLVEYTSKADIIVTGVGEKYLIKPEMVREEVVIIDCGFSRDGGKVFGDVDPRVAEKASLFTPVPGGVGPITVACLMQNLLTLAKG